MWRSGKIVVQTDAESVDRRLLAAAGILLLLMALPTLRWLAHEWWTNDYYSHGLLVVPVAAFFAWRLWPTIERHPANIGAAALIAGLVAYLVALASQAYFIASLALILILVGLTWFLLGPQALRRLAFPLAFLIFMVPLPFVEAQTLPLAQLTGLCAGTLIRLVGVNATVSGLQVTLPNANLVVGAQCSGVRSLIALLTLAAVMLYILRGPAWGKAILALATIPIAVAGNILRVASLLAVANVWGAQAGFTFYHTYSGIVFFLAALGGLLWLSRIVGCQEIRADL